MSIVVENISKFYGSQKALDDVSFKVERGTVCGFLGPNGAGKSTMMKILTCFIPPSSGNATVCNHNTSMDSIEVRKKVGYLPEHNPLYPEMYVKEYLEFCAAIYHTSNLKQRVDEMIELTGLTAEYKKRIGMLSKGYRQRVGLAQAMIHNPEVLILDEPTTGLDPNQLAEIRALIKNIGKEKTVIFSTHIMQEVEAICDRAIIINKGKIVADDALHHLQKKTEKQSVLVEFNAPVNAKSIEQLQGIISVSKKGNHFIITGNGKSDLRNELFQFAVGQNISILQMQNHEQNIEEIFQSLTKN